MRGPGTENGKLKEEHVKNTATHFCSLSRMKSNNFLLGKGDVGPESDGSVE